MNKRQKHVMTTYKSGKPYHYFRPPPSLRPFFASKTIRLSDDWGTALNEAEEIMRGYRPPDRLEPSKAEKRAARVMVSNATGRTKKKSFVSDISVDDVIGMMRAQSFRCAITKIPFDLEWSAKANAKRNAYAPSLDRIDNAKGYSVQNCRVVLSAVNYAMNEWGLETYLRIAKAASLYGTIENVERTKLQTVSNRSN